MSKKDENSQLEDMKKIFEALAAFGERENEGTEEDVMPEGYGEFGLEVTNPIPVKSILGNQIYLEQLHTLKGTKVKYSRIGSVHAPNIKSIIDSYIVRADGIETKLYICPYNKKNSVKAPRGFKLASGQAKSPNKQEPVFFDIPKAGARPQSIYHPADNRRSPSKPTPTPDFFEIPNPKAETPLSVNKFEKQKNRNTSQSTKIGGIQFRGGIIRVIVKYFLLVLLVFLAGGAIQYWSSTLENELAAKTLRIIGFTLILFGFIFIIKGIVSLIGRRFKPFSVFMSFFLNLGYILALTVSITTTLKIDTLPVYIKVLFCIYALIVLIIAIGKMAILQKMTDKAYQYQMNSVAMRLSGTSGIMFFTYMLRIFFPILLIGSIIFIFDLQLNTFWSAAFAICGFIWGYDIIRMIIRCNLIPFEKHDLSYKEKKEKTSSRIFNLLDRDSLATCLRTFPAILL